MKAIVLLKITSGEVREACNLLKKVKAVSESCMTFGRYDAVAFINADTLEEIRKIIEDEIQLIPGVTETLVCLTVSNDLSTPEAQQEYSRLLVDQGIIVSDKK